MVSHLHTYLFRHRRKWGLTQDDVRRFVALDAATQISRVERGECHPPTAQMLYVLGRVFGLTTAQLFPQFAAEWDEKIAVEAQALFDRTNDPTLTAEKKRAFAALVLERTITRPFT